MTHPRLELKRWKRPQYYCGASWPGYFALLGRSRDSDTLENCNFEVALAELGGETGEDDNGISHVVVVRESHFLVGWVEWLGVHESAPEETLAKAEDILKRLEDYPVLDDDKFSEAEFEAGEVEP